jgi:hypothetical protein
MDFHWWARPARDSISASLRGMPGTMNSMNADGVLAAGSPRKKF